MQDYKTVNILLVDDDSLDVELFRRSLKKNKISNPLHTASDGQEALELLLSNQIPKPLLIVLDINMPRMNGIEFLEALRADENYRDSVVFVMTTSKHDSDRIDAYNFNVAGYMVKSEIGDSFLDAVNLIECYWKTIQLPV